MTIFPVDVTVRFGVLQEKLFSNAYFTGNKTKD